MKTEMRIRGRRRAKLDEDQLALAFLLLAKQTAAGELPTDPRRATRREQ